jgi:hypothetical protein
VGKLITSISMTLFYVFLWEIGKRYYVFNMRDYVSVIVYALGFLRVILCFFPQNAWTDKNPPVKWAIIRNMPFLALGMIVMGFYLMGAFMRGGNFSFLWLAILISYACYIPVVLLSNRMPKIGMLMLPKSCAYVAIICMGFLIDS